MTKTGRQDGGEGGSHLQNLIPLLPLIPQGAGRARWQGVGATAKTKGPGFRGAGSVVIPPGFPQERGCRDGFLGAEKERERMTLLVLEAGWGLGTQRRGRRIDTDLPTLSFPSHLLQKP